MSREHAPAVKELTDKIVSLLITRGITASADRGLTEAFIIEPLEIALTPLLVQARLAQIVSERTYPATAQALDVELARWEPPKTEGK